MNQCIHFHVKRNQTSWAKALPLIRFQIMNTVNKSTGFSPFQLRFGCSPHVIPPLITPLPNPSPEFVVASAVINEINANVASAHDNLVLAKISQVFQANTSHAENVPYIVGEHKIISPLARKGWLNLCQNTMGLTLWLT